MHGACEARTKARKQKGRANDDDKDRSQLNGENTIRIATHSICTFCGKPVVRSKARTAST